MLDKQGLAERFNVTVTDICQWHARRVLPEPIRLDGVHFWRESDIELFWDYMQARHECRCNGGDPDAVDGPAVPVYSQGIPSVDPREIAAQVREQERRKRSKTLAAATKPTNAKPVEMPELKTSEVEGSV